jgi:hypothetical protein
MKGLLLPAAVAAGVGDNMTDLMRGDQWTAIMAALRGRARACELKPRGHLNFRKETLPGLRFELYLSRDTNWEMPT